MKQFVILVVAMIMLVKPFWPIVDYIANYDYIVNVLCENKDKPAMHCDGKCYLAKKLAEETKNDKNPFEEKRSKTEMLQVVFIQSLPRIDIGISFSALRKNNFTASKNLISNPFTTDISQPPELI